MLQAALHRGRPHGGAEDVPGDARRRTQTRNEGHYPSGIQHT
jgi:hypothetical protein